MGIGIQMAAEDNPEHARLLDDLKDQLLIVFLKALQKRGHSLSFPVAEVDDTGNDLLAFRIDFSTKTFHFSLRKIS